MGIPTWRDLPDYPKRLEPQRSGAAKCVNAKAPKDLKVITNVTIAGGLCYPLGGGDRDKPFTISELYGSANGNRTRI